MGGTASQFKKESGATITGLNMVGYDYDLDMKDGGALSNAQINGADATLVDGETVKFKLNTGKDSPAIDISGWT